MRLSFRFGKTIFGDGRMSMNLSRRGFIGGVASFLAMCEGRVFAAKPGAFTGGTPNLTFGVLSDVHICLAPGGKTLKKGYEIDTLVKAFTWFRDNGVDAVVIAGDMAHSGLVGELKGVAEAWFQVFPDDKAPDGRMVERIFVFGNHDWSSPGRAKAVFADEAELKANYLSVDPKKPWADVFHEDWTPIWRKTVKGIPVIGAHIWSFADAFFGTQWANNPDANRFSFGILPTPDNGVASMLQVKF